jgi:hypothetical protein
LRPAILPRSSAADGSRLPKVATDYIVSIETTAAGIFALASSDYVKLILEDQLISQVFWKCWQAKAPAPLSAENVQTSVSLDGLVFRRGAWICGIEPVSNDSRTRSLAPSFSRNIWRRNRAIEFMKLLLDGRHLLLVADRVLAVALEDRAVVPGHVDGGSARSSDAGVSR